MSNIADQFRSLAATLTAKPPYCSGALPVFSTELLLFYAKGEHAGRVDLGGASDEDLVRLEEACDPAVFGIGRKNVHDESYRKAGKLDVTDFAMHFNAGRVRLPELVFADLFDASQRSSVHAELYKLNVYGPKSFFKAHVDTPRSEKMFGSLVVIFPTRYKGGALVLRHKGQSRTFDTADLLSTASEKPHIAYVAFFSDVEHEVLPVESGYRITLTYNLYFTTTLPVPTPLIPKPFPNATSDVEVQLQVLLDDPEFLPEGGFLGFGLAHLYPIDTNFLRESGPERSIPLNILTQYLKGSDHTLLQACRNLSLRVYPRVIYKDDDYDVLCTHPVELPDNEVDYQVHGPPLWEYLCNEEEGLLLNPLDQPERDIVVHWVTRPSETDCAQGSYLTYGNEASMSYIYMQACLVVEIGEAGVGETCQ